MEILFAIQSSILSKIISATKEPENSNWKSFMHVCHFTIDGNINYYPMQYCIQDKVLRPLIHRASLGHGACGNNWRNRLFIYMWGSEWGGGFGCIYMCVCLCVHSAKKKRKRDSGGISQITHSMKHWVGREGSNFTQITKQVKVIED